jgi:hypothetical protein
MVANALSYPVEMNIITIDSEQSNGVIFPVKNIKKVKTLFSQCKNTIG